MNRFNRDFALVLENGWIVAESHNPDRLEEFRRELADEGTASQVVRSELPRSTSVEWVK
jgi:hypothetical protein